MSARAFSTFTAGAVIVGIPTAGMALAGIGVVTHTGVALVGAGARVGVAGALGEVTADGTWGAGAGAMGDTSAAADVGAATLDLGSAAAEAEDLRSAGLRWVGGA